MKLLEFAYRTLRDTVIGLGVMVFFVTPLVWGPSGIMSLVVWIVMIGLIAGPAVRFAWRFIDARR